MVACVSGHLRFLSFRNLVCEDPADALTAGVDFQHDLAALAWRVGALLQLRLHTAAAGAQVGDFDGGLALVEEGEGLLERRTAADLASIDRLKELLAAVAVYATGGREALLAYGQKKGGEVLRLTAQLGAERRTSR